LRGKTGTTNDQIDAWFTGYNNDIVASVWVGFDNPSSLGAGEFGATSALPIWLSFMENALPGTEQKTLPQPSGIVTLRIDPATGEAAHQGDKNAIFEIFLEENAPQISNTTRRRTEQTDNEEVTPEQLF
jgi:penicillin-binding protein 1A